jgi:hypothetical protein
VRALKRALLSDIIPNVLQAPLLGALAAAQEVSKFAYLAYNPAIRNLPAPGGSGDGK